MNRKIESDKLNQCFIFIWLILFCSGASLTEGFRPGILLITNRQLIVASYSLDVLGSDETILESKSQASMIPNSNDQLQEARILAHERYNTQQEQLPETQSKSILSAQPSSRDHLNRGTLHSTESVVRESSEVPPNYEHVTSHSSEVNSGISFPKDTVVNRGTQFFTEVVDPQEEIRPNKIEHATSQRVSEGDIHPNKNEHSTSQEVSDGDGKFLPSQEASRSPRCSEWIYNTSFIDQSLAETNWVKTNVRTIDITASWNDQAKFMTVESHLPTQ